MIEGKPWLSLPDEEPPERGLADLMAAARVQADAMSRQAEAPAPWWKRMFDVLRRPPVLALATIVVLLGGVIVVGRHPDQVQSAAPAAGTAAPPVAQPAAPATAVAPGEAAGAPRMEPPSQLVAPPEPPKHAEKKPVAVKSEPRTNQNVANEHAPSQHVATVKADTETTGTVKAAADQKAADRESVELATPDSTAEIGGDDGAPMEQGVVKPAVPNGGADAPVHKGATDAPAQKVVADPLARCRAAAARKDCAGAKACAREVEKADPTYYRANAGKDAALKSCL